MAFLCSLDTALNTHTLLSRWFSISAHLHLQRQKDAAQSKPVARKEISRKFFPPALLSPAAPTADMLDSHTEAAVVIFRVWLQRLALQICVVTLKEPNHCGVEGSYNEKKALSRAEMRFPPLVKRTGRIQTNVLSVTAGFILRDLLKCLLWQRVGGEIIYMPPQVLARTPHQKVSHWENSMVYEKVLGDSAALWIFKPHAFKSSEQVF